MTSHFMRMKKLSEIKCELPPDGLIVSCYLESMRGAEMFFLKSICKLRMITALRVEGIENIEYAKANSILPIIGLIKRLQDDGSYITASIDDLLAVEEAGADFVAIDSRTCNSNLASVYNKATIPIAADIEYLSEAINAYKLGAVIISTTFKPKAFDLIKEIKSSLRNCKINLEGGIETRKEVQQAFQLGANYVTIGKMINDPSTIIKHLLGGNIAWL